MPSPGAPRRASSSGAPAPVQLRSLLPLQLPLLPQRRQLRAGLGGDEVPPQLVPPLVAVRDW